GSVSTTLGRGYLALAKALAASGRMGDARAAARSASINSMERSVQIIPTRRRPDNSPLRQASKALWLRGRFRWLGLQRLRLDWLQLLSLQQLIDGRHPGLGRGVESAQLLVERIRQRAEH